MVVIEKARIREEIATQLGFWGGLWLLCKARHGKMALEQLTLETGLNKVESLSSYFKHGSRQRAIILLLAVAKIA